jgi:GNAT superfamily N-acetyltransferase
MPVIRLMTEADAEGALDATVAAFEDLARRFNEPPETPPDPAVALLRYRHLIRTDPAGAWVVEDEQGIGGCALALRREDVWGLSLLIVRPDLQSSGVGRELLARAHEYAEGARGRIILSSQDSRAIRAYSRLGLQAHPCFWATGTARGIVDPGVTRAGTAADIPFTEVVDRHVRGAAHGVDIDAQLQMGARMLISERGYAMLSSTGSLRLLAALDDDGARELLRTAFLRAPDGEASAEWLSSAQQWAIEECRDAGLELRTDRGAVFLDGDVGPFSPYLPNGAFL